MIHFVLENIKTLVYKVYKNRTEELMRGKYYLSCGVDLAVCVRSAPQRDGMDEETAAEKQEDGTGGTDCPESGGSSPTGNRRREK